MGFFKSIAKAAKSGHLGLAPQMMSGGNPMEGTPAQAMFGGLASHLAAEKKQHAPHEKVKEIHHHHHKKK